MAATATPIFIQTPKNKYAAVTAAQTDQSGATTTNLVTLVTAGTNGSKISEITVTVPVTSVAAVAMIFVDDAGNGTFKLYDTFTITAITVSNTVPGYRSTKQYDNFILTAGSVVKVGVTVINNPTIFHALYGDF